jgi:adenylyltransferase/sulfurtransferase
VLVSGAAVRLEGQIAVFPNRGEGPCYRCIYNDEDEWLGNCQGNGVLAPVPGVIGAMMAVETLRIATGARSALESRLLLWDATFGQWQAVAIRPDPQCPVCQDST